VGRATPGCSRDAPFAGVGESARPSLHDEQPGGGLPFHMSHSRRLLTPASTPRTSQIPAIHSLVAACSTKELTRHRDLYGQVSRAVWATWGERSLGSRSSRRLSGHGRKSDEAKAGKGNSLSLGRVAAHKHPRAKAFSTPPGLRLIDGLASTRLSRRASLDSGGPAGGASFLRSRALRLLHIPGEAAIPTPAAPRCKCSSPRSLAGGIHGEGAGKTPALASRETNRSHGRASHATRSRTLATM
jgi:hypothetical protein